MGPEDDIRKRLEALEAEAAKLRESLDQTPKEPEEAASSEEATEATEAAESAEPTAAEVEEVVRNIQRYRLEAQRGNAGVSRKYLEEAAKILPGHTLVLEAQADELIAGNKVGEAMALYKRAFEADSTNVSAEKKHAQLVFASRAAGAGLLMTTDESLANSRISVLLSALIPGMGQLVQGQYVKGAVMMGLFVLSLAYLIAVPGTRETLRGLMGGTDRLQPGVFVAMGILVVNWFASLLDMQTRSKTIAILNADAPKKERIKPPVDLPFE